MKYIFFILLLGFCHQAYAELDYFHYQSPFSARYASEEMSQIFSLQQRHACWRKVWVALAQAERDLGLPISDAQVEEMKAAIDTIDFKVAAKYEKELKHDVMAHVHAYGEQCPLARPIIHLGATSCTITDNADQLIMRSALKLIQSKLKLLMKNLAMTALHYKDLPCLGYTHFQSAQPTTVGKRMSLWLQDFYLDYLDLAYRLDHIYFLGVKGTTGTQASFLELFDGDREKVIELEKRFAAQLEYNCTLPVSGQTYTRKIDKQILEVLSGIAVSAHKMSTDLRLLAHLKEIEEPFGKHQVGSSAMPYKRNPMENERVCSLARYIMSQANNPQYTAATQWFERTLDDSANRRLSIPEAFLATDTLLDILANIAENMVVYPKVIEKHLDNELPFMATENILMACVKKGADRQEIHERIREHSQLVANKIKNEGAENDLLERLANDPVISLTRKEILLIIKDGDFTGCAANQVENFVNLYIFPIIN